jgi:hypothetical protein
VRGVTGIACSVVYICTLPALWHWVDPPILEQRWSSGVAEAVGAVAIAAAAPAAKTGVT